MKGETSPTGKSKWATTTEKKKGSIGVVRRNGDKRGRLTDAGGSEAWMPREVAEKGEVLRGNKDTVTARTRIGKKGHVKRVALREATKAMERKWGGGD